MMKQGIRKGVRAVIEDLIAPAPSDVIARAASARDRASRLRSLFGPMVARGAEADVRLAELEAEVELLRARIRTLESLRADDPRNR